MKVRLSYFALGLLFFSSFATAVEIRVAAAASLTDALREIGAAYTAETGDKVVFNFGGSNQLARQIEAGAPLDIFFSADETQMDGLEKKNLLVPGSRTNLLGNQLAIITTVDSKLVVTGPEILATAAVKKIALADPKAVPAGVYTRAYYEKLGLWKTIEPKVVPTENVRAALAAVESGNVDAGVVYLTDAKISKKVKIAFLVPAKDGPQIRYPVALLKNPDADDPIPAGKFFSHLLLSPKAKAVFEKFGFTALEVVSDVVPHDR